jgi:hypothetical protein
MEWTSPQVGELLEQVAEEFASDGRALRDAATKLPSQVCIFDDRAVVDGQRGVVDDNGDAETIEKLK